MIVYGTRATLLKTEFLFEPCLNCNTNNCVQINIFQQYAHIFWIPFFPLRKTGVSVCNNCRQVLKLKQMPPSLRLSFDNAKTHTKAPIWHFAGLFLVGLIAIAVTISNKQKEEKVGRFVLNPKKGDVFEIKIKEDQYTLYKIERVEGDTVYFFANKYQTDQESGLSDLESKEFATDSVYGLPKSDLINMNKKEEILDIHRD